MGDLRLPQILPIDYVTVRTKLKVGYENNTGSDVKYVNFEILNKSGDSIKSVSSRAGKKGRGNERGNFTVFSAEGMEHTTSLDYE